MEQKNKWGSGKRHVNIDPVSSGRDKWEQSFPRRCIEAENRYSKLTENGQEQQRKPLINRNVEMGNGKRVRQELLLSSHSLSW